MMCSLGLNIHSLTSLESFSCKIVGERHRRSHGQGSRSHQIDREGRKVVMQMSKRRRNRINLKKVGKVKKMLRVRSLRNNKRKSNSYSAFSLKL